MEAENKSLQINAIKELQGICHQLQCMNRNILNIGAKVSNARRPKKKLLKIWKLDSFKQNYCIFFKFLTLFKKFQFLF